MIGAVIEPPHRDVCSSVSGNPTRDHMQHMSNNPRLLTRQLYIPELPIPEYCCRVSCHSNMYVAFPLAAVL